MTKSICVWYWFIFLSYVCPFLKNSCWTIYIDDFVNKASGDKGGACANAKAQTDTVGYYRN